MGGSLHAPNGVKAALRQVESEGVHHGEATVRRQGGRGEGLSPGNLRGTDADRQHIESVVARQDAGAPADAAAHIQHRAARGELIQSAPAHELMHEVDLRPPEIPGSWRISVMPQVHMVAPEPLQQGVVGPAVVSLGHALGAPKPPGGLQPQHQGRDQGGHQKQQQGHQPPGLGRKHSAHPLASFLSEEEKVSLRTVRAASWRRV